MESHFSPISIVLEIKLNELMPVKHWLFPEKWRWNRLFLHVFWQKSTWFSVLILAVFL